MGKSCCMGRRNRARFGRIDGLVNNAGISLAMSIRVADEVALDQQFGHFSNVHQHGQRVQQCCFAEDVLQGRAAEEHRVQF